MQFPKKAIFAFNANIDHLVNAGEKEVETADREYPDIASAMGECFSTGVQKEIQIDAKACGFFLSAFKSKKITGGQAGNAAEQASALGVDCYLHSNFASEELLGLFRHPSHIFVPTDSGFARAGEVSPQVAGAHHFVFENPDAATRFICSFDPFPAHPESAYCEKITAELPDMKKAFVGGIHLVKTADRARKFVSEIARWKKTSPGLEVFLEMGEFQSEGVLEVVRRELFPLADIVGLNEVELARLGCTPEELLGEAKCFLLHTGGSSAVYPKEKENASALGFARKAAAFKAENGRCGTEAEISACGGEFIEKPAWTVGLGDTLSCAYFMAL